MAKKALVRAVAGVGLVSVAWAGLEACSATDGGPASSESARRVDLSRGTVELATRGRGPSVVVLHGTPGGFDQGLWLGRELLDSGFTVLAPSRPGYLGTPLDGHAGPAAQADLLAELLRTWNESEVAVVAWSGGSPTAVELAVRHPGLVRSLVLLAPVLEATALPADPAADAGLKAAGLLLRCSPGLVARWVTGDTAVARLLVEDRDVRTRMTELIATLVSAGAGDAGRSADRRTLRTWRPPPLDRIRAPTLVVQGGADDRVSLADTRRAVGQIPHAELRVLEGAGHVVTLHPAFSRHRTRIRAFVRTAGQRPASRP